MKPPVALVTMSEHGHVKRALALARELVSAGTRVHFFTSPRYAEEVRFTGALFHDLFEERSLESADSESVPVPCRYVSFAGAYADALALQLRSLNVRLLIHDAFAVIGVPVAQILGIPRIAICAGHNMPPRETIAQLEKDPRVKVAAACQTAVARLKQEYGLTETTPFSYADSLSPLLNIVSEPPEFMWDHEKPPFEPLMFFGCLDRSFQERFRSVVRSRKIPNQPTIYCSIGTVASRYYAQVISSLFQGIIQTAREIAAYRFILSTGGSRNLGPLNLPSNVVMRHFVDQADVLSNSDIYISHHGMNSTHESIYLLKPMISYPLFHDQPGLARRCQEFGLAVPLTQELRGPVETRDITSAVGRVIREQAEMQPRLEQARTWEDQVIASRPDVIRRILSLV